MTIKVRTLVPDFYAKFKCKAGACQHTCCQKWIIDVDEVSAQYYFQQKGKLGEDLKANIVHDKAGYHFRLNKAGLCPFLQKDGLCKLILELGEDSLCDICTAHPRFYEYFEGDKEDIELGGVGMCCEATCDLLLANEAPLQFTLEGATKPLNFAQVLKKIAVEMPDALEYVPNLDPQYLKFVLECMGKVEPIDKEWTRHIQELKHMLPDLQPKLTQAVSTYSKTLFTKIFQYILYRQLDQSFDISTTVILAYAQLNMAYVLLEYLVTGDLPETIRRWSEEIEYDDENVDMLLRLVAAL